MLRSVLYASTMTVLLVRPWPAVAEAPLTLERALALARAQSPAVLASRLEVEEARGRLAGARALFAENPTVRGGLGRRHPRQDRSDQRPQVELELVQPIGIGGQRGARVAAADAETAGATAAGEGVLRRIEAEVARAFLRGLHAAERLRLATATEETLARSARALERRHQAGDVPVLESPPGEDRTRARVRPGASSPGAGPGRRG